MYYIRIKMKNYIFKILRYFYYLTLLFLLILYLFPGSIIGFLLYGDFSKQPLLTKNTIGTSLNHLLYFVFLTTMSLLDKNIDKNFFNNNYMIISLAVLLELTHLIIPNRSFEYIDLFANISGVIIVLIFYKFIKCIKS